MDLLEILHLFGEWSLWVVSHEDKISTSLILLFLLYFAYRQKRLESSIFELPHRLGLDSIATAEHLDQASTYAKIEQLINDVRENSSIQHRTIRLAALNAFSNPGKLALNAEGVGLAARYLQARNDFLLKRGKVREIFIVNNSDRLDFILERTRQMEGQKLQLEVKIFASATLPYLSPLIIGNDHVFLAIEDRNQPIMERSLYTHSQEIAHLCNEYFSRVWETRSGYLVRDINGMDEEEVAKLKQRIRVSSDEGIERTSSRDTGSLVSDQHSKRSRLRAWVQSLISGGE